jgi:hypothetical protein
MSDDEAASKQLLRESIPSDELPALPPAVVLGADLLNAARIDHRRSSPTGGMARNNRVGKLKRVSMIPEGSRTNLARRGDVYEIELSPEKSNYALPEKVNNKPLKIVKKTKPAAGVAAAAPRVSSKPTVHDADEPHLEQDGLVEDMASTEPAMRSSPPEVAPIENIIAVDNIGGDVHLREAGDVEIEESLRNGKPRCTAVFYRYDKKTGPSYQQCLRPGTDHTDVGARCMVHMNRPATVRCGEMMVSDDGPTQCYRAATWETVTGAQCPIHAEQQATPRTTPRDKRKSAPVFREEHPAKIVRRHSQGAEKPLSSGRSRAQAQESEEARHAHVQAPVQGQSSNSVLVPAQGESSSSQPTRKRGRPRKDGSNASVVSSQQLPTRTRNSKAQPATSHEVPAESHDSPADERSDFQPDAEETEDSPAQDEETGHVVQLPESIDTVFKFLDLEEREGACQTKLARKILRMCEKCHARFQDETTSIDAVAKDATEMQETLKYFMTRIGKEVQLAFKIDTYSYIFRSLTLYLQALHDWLLKTHEPLIESLDALRILTPLMKAIIALKDTISQWNVTIPRRYKGDRLVKDVDSRLIAPLRRVSKTFSEHLSQLWEAKQRHEQYKEMRRKMKEHNEAEDLRIQAAEAMAERKKHWQDLHIVRMQCEPDVYRRRKLFHTKFEDLVERDANGVIFERLPIFKSRSNPPRSRISELADEVEWTEEEETAVLEGLQYCAGELSAFPVGQPKCLLMSNSGPHVFEKMFKIYCDPTSSHPRAGDLRNRNVGEIVSKARWIRSTMLILRQESGEPVEDWVTGIPLLP